MKIAFILSSLWLSGGVRDVVEHTNRLMQRGHLVSIVIPFGTFDRDMAAEIDERVPIIQAKINRSITSPKVSAFEKALLSWSLAWNTPRSDVVVSTHSTTTIAGFLAARLLRKGKPVWYYQDYLEMYLDRPIESWLVKHALRWHSKALVLSHDSKAELERYVSGKEVVVTGAGLSHAEFYHPLALEDRLKINDGQKRYILFLGDMRPRKGLYDFLEAARLVFHEIPDIHIWIVSKENCNIQSDLPFEYIYRPSRADLARLYACCDLYVAASWWESFGFPPLEAMACGAPVVMTDSRGGREFAKPGENCLMTPSRDPVALADAMLRVLTDEQLAARLRQNGPLTAAGFTWETATDRFENALHELFSV
jgi:glycosyltransferase involved in cell wall biosynthesis